MLTAFISNLFLFNKPLYQFTLFAQELFVLAALIGIHFVNGKRISKLFRFPGMFVQMNYALAIGLYRCLFIRQNGTWERTDRNVISGRSTENQKEVKACSKETETQNTNGTTFHKAKLS